MPTKRWLGRIGSSVMVAGVIGALGGLGGGCLTRPVTNAEPTTKTNFTSVVKQAAIDKVDLLFMIDNSQSMGDKQELLRQAVPDLIDRLINPLCIDLTDSSKVDGKSANGDCSKVANSKAEFKPVHDMHIGIVSSSLGGRGADACPASANPINMAVDSHQDDKGELINRSDPTHNQSETAVADAQPSGFLAWFPTVAANMGKPNPVDPAITDPVKLGTDFQDMVSGVHEYGCGWEAQLEAWYRFLVQPDPYDSVSVPTNNVVKLQGIDKTILQQRHDFLRPDSLLAVIVVTDEDATEVTDPLALGGQGWAYMDGSKFPGGPGTTAAMGTSACGGTPSMGQANAGPTSANCTSCGFTTSGAVVADKMSGGNCSKNGGYYDPNATPPQDSLNVRGVYQKQRFGVDPDFPIKRYYNGLTAPKVPNQQGEHPSPGNYVGTPNCSNPIYSMNLPTDPTADLCNLQHGPRTSDLVFYAAITGVPHQLLQSSPGDGTCPAGTNPADCPQLDTIPETSSGDNTKPSWQSILGADPESYDFTGINPHMFVSITPRAGLPPPGPGNGSDPINGREWDTGGKDQQYACTFPLTTPRDCSKAAGACDCTAGQSPPLCDSANPTSQIRGKAYPSPKPLELVHLMGTQGIVSSMCPIHTSDNAQGDDPLYGYRPAVKALVDRLKNALAGQCLPQALTPSNCGDVQCLILETISNQTVPVGGDGNQVYSAVQKACGALMGLTAPDPDVLNKFNSDQSAQWAANGGAKAGLGPDPRTLLTCEVTQLVPGGGAACPTADQTLGHYIYVNDFTGGTCANSGTPGWCYVTGAAAQTGGCSQQILFSASGNPPIGAKINLQCIETAGGGADAGAGGGG